MSSRLLGSIPLYSCTLYSHLQIRDRKVRFPGLYMTQEQPLWRLLTAVDCCVRRLGGCPIRGGGCQRASGWAIDTVSGLPRVGNVAWLAYWSDVGVLGEIIQCFFVVGAKRLGSIYG